MKEEMCYKNIRTDAETNLINIFTNVLTVLQAEYYVKMLFTL